MKQILPLLFCLFFTGLYAGKITGKVTDTDGNPLPFATILVKGTPYGVTTNSEGFYSIILAPGDYAVECRYVGYTTTEKRISLKDEDLLLDFMLRLQRLELDEIVVNTTGDDPAYEIIRNAIRQRPYYNGQVSAFSADVYVKGMLSLLSLPQRVLGRRIENKDLEELALDSSGRGIIYLSESLTHVSEQKPEKLKMEVVSSRVSGSDGFGFDFPVFIDFYKNVVDVSKGAFSRRGFISPIADNALNFYRYKYMGSFFEDGKQVHTISVIPKRSFEPLFSGVINISEGDWHIFSCRMKLTKESQLQILDSLEISQIHTHQYKDIWRVKNQTIQFHINQFGVSLGGYFVNVYSNYNLNPQFAKGFFDHVIISYDTAANKRPETYWDTVRPVPLESDEIFDFYVKDSLKVLRDSLAYNRDSLRKAQEPVKLMDILVWDMNRKYYSKTRSTDIRLEALFKGLQYNTVEGVSINPSLVLSRQLPGMKSTIRFITDIRYGFNNGHLNPWTGLVLTNRFNPKGKNKFQYYEYYLAGGKRVSQFFKEATLAGIDNSISTLLYGRNDMKLYENYFIKTGFKETLNNGAQLLIEGVYEDRLPLENTTDFLFNSKWKKRLTPNYPVQVMDQQFEAHKALVLHGSFSFQPGQRYIQYPDTRYSLGSDYPVFTVHYYKGLPGVMGSDEDFDRWQFDIWDMVKLRLAGRLGYFFSTGGFLNDKSVFVQDFKHFHGVSSHVADEYLKSFQYTSMYQYSNVSSFYAQLHFEHHADGLITNKIPLLKKWNWFLVEGANALYLSPDAHHLEIFAGLENILKMFRVDALVRIQDGFKPALTYRIGLGGLLGDPANIVRFKRQEKIINSW